MAKRSLAIISDSLESVFSDLVAIKIWIDGISLIYGTIERVSTLIMELQGKADGIEVRFWGPVSIERERWVVVKD